MKIENEIYSLYSITPTLAFSPYPLPTAILPSSLHSSLVSVRVVIVSFRKLLFECKVKACLPKQRVPCSPYDATYTGLRGQLEKK